MFLLTFAWSLRPFLVELLIHYYFVGYGFLQWHQQQHVVSFYMASFH
jgi:hypothetical protein